MEHKFKLKGVFKNMTVFEDKLILSEEARWFTNEIDRAIYFKNITGIEYSKASTFKAGYIFFIVDGNEGGFISNDKRVLGNLGRENAFVFKSKISESAVAAKIYIEEGINKAKSSTVPTVVNFNFADELRKFKELLDEGVINQQEYDLKKKQLLGINIEVKTNNESLIQDTKISENSHGLPARVTSNESLSAQTQPKMLDKNELKKIKRLYDHGIIDEKEFDERNNKLIHDSLVNYNAISEISGEHDQPDSIIEKKSKSENNGNYLLIILIVAASLIMQFHNEIGIEIPYMGPANSNLSIYQNKPLDNKYEALKLDDKPKNYYVDLAKNGKFPRCAGSYEFDKCVELEKKIAGITSNENNNEHSEPIKLPASVDAKSLEE